MNRFLRPQRLNEADLALNLSFVLHEHSESAAVRGAIRAIDAHASAIARVGAGLVPALSPTQRARSEQGRYETGPDFHSGTDRHSGEQSGMRSRDDAAGVPTGITYWLTATIGLPDRISDALGVEPDIPVRIDANNHVQQSHEFFRAPARLSLPDWNEATVGVAALILRPDRRTSQLIVEGPFEWPAEQRAALRAVEQIIQAHVGQWMPPRALWSAPAEALMPDEVYLGSDDASRMS